MFEIWSRLVIIFRFLSTSSVSPNKCRDSSVKWATTVHFHILSNSPFINIVIRCYTTYAVVKATLNKSTNTLVTLDFGVYRD